MAIVRRLTLALIVGVLWTLPLRAQAPSGAISGRVVDSATRLPIADVTVMVEGTRLGTVTRADGTFLIGGVPVGVQTVRARRIGYGSPQQSVTIIPNGTATVEFALDRRVAILEEVVTTGYGTQRRVAITGSISTIDPAAANVGVSPNVNSLIQGRAAGVYLAQNSGEPGAGAQIRVRGGTSVSASNEPLYVVDGVPIVTGEVEPNGMATDGTPPLPRSPLNLINPSDIESISILKDASASIYGTRAANGVILITTKKGSGTGPGIEYEFYVGRSSSPRSLDLLNGDEYRAFVQAQVPLKTACLANPPAGTGTPAERCAGVGLDATRLAGLGTANTDWERAVTRSANTVNQNLSFAGGAANTQYRASLNYMDQQGIVLANGFKRYQARVNGAHQALGGRLRLGLNLTGSQIRNDYLTFENTGGFEGGVFINMVNYNPTQPITVTDATTGETVYFEVPGQTSVRNPVALAEQLLDFGTTTLALGNMSADLDILSNLTGTVNVGVNRTDATRGQYWPRVNPVGSTFSGRALQEQRDNTLTNLSTVLTYRPEFSDKHSVDVLGGYEFSEYTRSEFGAEARNFLTDAFGYNRLQSGGTLLPPTSYREESRIVGFFSRLNYSLLDRYFLTASIRRDGSSRFGEGNKWAVFPAVSASWRISQEGFMRLGPLSELRLRAGWGRLGNPAVPPYASLLLLSAEAGSRYGWGDVPVTGVAPIRNPNPNLKWEETDLTNVALDYGFLNNRFTGSLEYYVKKTRDLIFEVPVPQPAVVATRLENIGSMTNKGLELSLDAQVLDRPEFNWTAGLVFSRDRNELGANTFVTTGGISGQGQSGNQAQRILPGQPLGTFFGPQFVGIDPQGRELFACTPTGPTDTQCVNGQMATPLRSSDYRIIGDANPDFTVGLRSLVNWRKFDLSFLINSQQGLDVFNNTALVYATKSNALQNKNFLESAINDGVAINQPQIYSSRWIEDGSFVRLQNVTLGYTFDQLPIFRAARGTRVYVSGDNLLLFTDYSGYDPEVHTQSGLASRGIDYLHYPRARTITGGIRVAF
jgi:TonB-dependent starch-binding outer membrane protein SusC